MQKEHYDIMRQTEDTHWWYRVRRAMICRLVGKIANKKKNLRILDIGCGTGGLFQELQKYGEVSGIDFSERAVNYCKTRGLTGIIVGDAQNLPFANESFDIVVALDVMEHLKNDAKGCREVQRVLKKGGTALITVPAFMFLWSITDVVSEHFRRYTKKEIVECVKKTGLSIKRATYFNTFLFPFIAIVRLLVRLFGIKMKNENTVGGKFSNAIFYIIFKLESLLLPYLTFPFGVSVLVVAEKK